MAEEERIERFEIAIFELVKERIRRAREEEYRKYWEVVAEGEKIYRLPDSPKKLELKKRHLELIARKIEEVLRERERHRALGRSNWELWLKTKDPKYRHLAFSHWGMAGWKTVLRKRYYEPYRDFWLDEFARETKLEFIGIDADTGRRIYYDLEREVYAEVDENGRVTYESPELQLDETISVETPEGHDAPLTCEVTTRFKLKKITRDALRNIERGVQTQLDTFLKSYEDPRLAKTKRPRPFSHIKATFDPLKTGIEYKVRVRPETLAYPRGEVIIERSSRLYPEWRTYPALATFQVHLPTAKVEKRLPMRRLKSTIRKEEETIEKRKEVKEVL